MHGVGQSLSQTYFYRRMIISTLQISQVTFIFNTILSDGNQNQFIYISTSCLSFVLDSGLSFDEETTFIFDILTFSRNSVTKLI